MSLCLTFVFALNLAQSFARGHHIAIFHLNQADAQVFQKLGLRFGKLRRFRPGRLACRGRR